MLNRLHPGRTNGKSTSCPRIAELVVGGSWHSETPAPLPKCISHPSESFKALIVERPSKTQQSLAYSPEPPPGDDTAPHASGGAAAASSNGEQMLHYLRAWSPACTKEPHLIP